MAISVKLLKGFAKKKNSKNPRLLWKWVGGSRFHSNFFFKSFQNSHSTDILE